MERLIEDEQEYENLWPKDNVLENFCLVTVDVNRIDHLELKGNKRYLYRRQQKNEENEEQENDWIVCEVCP